MTAPASKKQILSTEKLHDWNLKISSRFDSQLAKAITVYLKDEYYDSDDDSDNGFSNIIHDFAEDCDNSDIIQTIRVEHPLLKLNDVKCDLLFNFIKRHCLSDTAAETSGPSDIDWSNPTMDEEQKARQYMDIQTPGAIKHKENKNLIRMIALGQKNYLPIITILMDMYQLRRAQNLMGLVVNKKPPTSTNKKLGNIQKYTDGNVFWRKHKRKTFCMNALRDYEHRLSGGGIQSIFQPKIYDNINDYLRYTLVVSKVIHNLVQIEKKCLPLQVDMIILGQDIPLMDDLKTMDMAMDNNNHDSDEDSDVDSDDLEIDFTAGKGINSFYGNQAKPLKEENFEKLLSEMKLKYEKFSVNLPSYGNISSLVNIASDASLVRSFSLPFKKILGEQRSTRIIIFIDRTNRTPISKMKDFVTDEQEDNVYIYQLFESKFNDLPFGCSDETMGHKTKSYLIPDFMNKWKLEANITHRHQYIGAGQDIGLRSFVMSWHLLQDNDIRCYQYLKSQKLRFCLHHMLHLWPKVFAKGFDEVYECYKDIRVLQKEFGLSLEDKILDKWVAVCDPELAGVLKHFDGKE